MTRFSIPALASVSVLALGLIAAPATVDLQDEVIGAKSAWAKGGKGGGNGGGNGGGHGHGRDKAGKEAGTEVSSTDTDDLEEGDEEEPTTGKSLPQTAIDGKTNSSAYHSANYVGGETAATSTTGKTVNENSAVSYSKGPDDTSTTPDNTGTTPDGTTPDGTTPDGTTPDGTTTTPEELTNTGETTPAS
jgi:hypothetical protein